MKQLLIILLMLFAVGRGFAQTGKEYLGKVSYITAQNIYVRFDGANNVQQGDTLFINLDGQNVPLLIVESKSSLSAMGKPLSSVEISVGEEVFGESHLVEDVAVTPEVKPVVTGDIEKEEKSGEVRPRKNEQEPDTFHEVVKGRLSAASYSTFSGAASNTTRLRYTLSLQALNVSNSRFSVDSYITFTHKTDDWASVQDNLFNALKIYSLAVRYQPGKLSSVWVGRKINPNLSSIGAIDGVQYETGYKNFSFGAVLGFRPDYKDYSLNTNLLEYGAYLAHNIETKTGTMQNSLAFFEQQNNGKTDRRFLYFQHSNSLLKNLFLFLSSEVDLYKVENDISVNKPSLTSLYVSLRYRIMKQLSVYASYDARRNVIYYETFKNMVDQMLDEAMRQGVQFRVNYRPANNLTLGVNTTYRMRDNDIRATQTLNSFVSLSKIPGINATTTFSSNLIRNSYLDGRIFGVRMYKDLLDGKIYSSLGYRYVDYNFVSSGSNSLQHIGEFDVTWRISKKLSLSANYEGTFEKTENYNRVYLNLIKRF